eukprot:530144_1
MAEFELETILDHQLKTHIGGVTEQHYFIKWKGYDNPADNTWEPRSNLLHLEMLAEYEEEHNLMNGMQMPMQQTAKPQWHNYMDSSSNDSDSSSSFNPFNQKSIKNMKSKKSSKKKKQNKKYKENITNNLLKSNKNNNKFI